MELDNVYKHFENEAGISQAEFESFLNYSNRLIFKKNSYIVEQNLSKSNFYFIISGCLVTYFEDNNKFTHVVQFGMNYWWAGDIESVTKNKPSNYTIKALTDSVILSFTYQALEKIIFEMPIFQNYFRFLYQNTIIYSQKRIIQSISLTAEQRYEAFLKLFPKSELIIPQKYVASYLGITPEFFSKLKAKMYSKYTKKLIL
jgi:CRP-like cAMP-binding protein